MNSPALEFWYDYRKQNNILRYSLLGTILLLVLSFFTIMALAARKPFIIRVASNGETAIIDDSNPYSRADGQEAKYFVQEFLNLYLAPNSESVTKDLSVALSWMVPDLQAKHTSAYVDNEYVSQIKSQQLRSELYLSSLAASEDGEGYFVISKGIVESYKKDTQTSVKRGFEARINVSHSQRSAFNPQGLVISNIDIEYRDQPLYKGEEIPSEDFYAESAE